MPEQILRCPYCGNRKIDEKTICNGKYHCESCDTKFWISEPVGSEEYIRLLTASDDRIIFKQFEKAIVGYDAVLQTNPNSITALWGMFLAEYGIEYVSDNDRVLKPTFNRLSRDSVLKNKYFVKLLTLIDDDEKAKYIEKADIIEQNRINALEEADKNEPYDIFICYKNRIGDQDSDPTPEAEWALDYYTYFTLQGYKVFYAPESLPNDVGVYEAMIFNALFTAKCMIILCSNIKHLDAPWVNNEWSRFSRRKINEPKIDFCVVYDKIKPYDLPYSLRPEGKQAYKHAEAECTSYLEKTVYNLVEKSKKPQKTLEERIEEEKIKWQASSEQEKSRLLEEKARLQAEHELELKKLKAEAEKARQLAEVDVGKAKQNQLEEEAAIKAEEAKRKAELELSTKYTQGLAFEELSDGTYEVKKGKIYYEEIVVIPALYKGKKVTSIGAEAFSCCSSLTSITIPGSVTTIGVRAFYGCSSLKSITIPDSVTTISSYAFYSCSYLTSITIPGSVTTIGAYAFYSCSSLTSITIPDSVTTIGSYAFYSCSSLKSITIPGSVTTIGSYAFYSCSSLTSITIPDSVTTIGASAFSFCRSLKSITIPDSVTTIGEYAFSFCDSLTSITIPGSVTTIGEYAFSSCSYLTSITIPGSVTTIGAEAFSSCSSLKSITIPDSVTNIGAKAFSCCSSLKSITIPGSVTTIGSEAFSYCSSLKSIKILGGRSVVKKYDKCWKSNCNAVKYYK